jgi:hypothetical protein
MATKKLAFGGMSNAVRAAVNKAASQIPMRSNQSAQDEAARAAMQKVKPGTPQSSAMGAKLAGMANKVGLGQAKPTVSPMAKSIGGLGASALRKVMMKKGGMAECKTIAKKEVKGHEKRMHGMAKGGSIDGCAVRGKTKATMVKMKKGGAC